jgi:hypothetical protein
MLRIVFLIVFVCDAAHEIVKGPQKKEEELN